MIMYVIYDKPSDFPYHFVVRQFIIDPGKVTPGKICGIARTLDEIRSQLPSGLSRIDRFEEDDPNIVEIYF